MIVVVFVVCVPVLAQEKPPKEVYSFGVVPQYTTNTIFRLWEPVLHWISEESSYQLELFTAKNIPEFAKTLADGTYDFAYMNPHQFILFHESIGYQAIAHQKNKKITGIIVTHLNSPFLSLNDLNAHTLSFPSYDAFGASNLTRGNLNNAEIDFTPAYVSSHDSVYLTVANGIFPAGGGVANTLKNMPEHVKDNLKVLWTSEGYTPHAIAALPTVPDKVRLAVQGAVIAMHNDPEGRKLLQALNFTDGFIEAQNSDWDDVRNLNNKNPTSTILSE